MSAFDAVLFDVDGVLVDSLDSHLRILRDKALQYGVRADVPAPARLKQMLKSGTVISPMFEFFRVVGFPPELAERGVEDYRSEFLTVYRSKPYPGAEALLERLKDAKLSLGIVTSNTLANVRSSLGALFDAFSPELVFDTDHASAPTKVVALELARKSLGVSRERLLFVGDQQSDFEAAKASATRFLGVSYGWVFDEDEPGMDIARSPAEVGDYVLGAR
jgi:phosphoglycolate phosphatase-like HAD superfamily hydrolase